MARLVMRDRQSKHDKKETEFFVPDEEHDLHTEQGSITKEQLRQGGVVNVGKERFTILPFTFMDQYARLPRGAQVIQPKDLGLIIAETALSKEDVVLDIGAGSGFASILLSRIAKQVYAYDCEKKSLDVTEANLKELGIANVELKRGDAYKAETIAQENEVDLFLLDVPEPWRALGTAKKALKPGAWLVGYTPCTTQATKLVEALGDEFFHVKTVELLEREWKVKGEAVRPESKDFQHTAFLTFLRKT